MSNNDLSDENGDFEELSVVGSGIKGLDNPFGGWQLSESELFLHKGDYESHNLRPFHHIHMV